MQAPDRENMDAASFSAQANPADIVADFERRSQRFETPCGDGAMAWRTWGSGPPILLFHGSHGSWSHWIRTIDALAADRTVWAADLPFFGEAASAPSSDMPTITAIIAEGMRHLMPAELPVDIAGFSFGGVAAAALAANYPDLVRRVILVSTGGLDTPLGVIEMHRVGGLKRDEERREAHRKNLLALMLHHPDTVDDLTLHLQGLNGYRGRLNPSELVLPDKLLKSLPGVAAQIDAIWGEHDAPHPNPAAQEEVLRGFKPDMDFRTIRGSGHWVMYERPAAFNLALLDILSAPLRSRL